MGVYLDQRLSTSPDELAIGPTVWVYKCNLHAYTHWQGRIVRTEDGTYRVTITPHPLPASEIAHFASKLLYIVDNGRG